MLCPCCGKSCSHIGRHLGNRKNHKCLQYFWANTEEDAGQGKTAHMLRVDEVQYTGKLRKKVFLMQAELYWFRYLSETMMIVLRCMIRALIAFAAKEMPPPIRHIINDEAKATLVLSVLASRLDFFKEMDTEAQVRAYSSRFYKGLACLENVVGPSKADVAYGIDYAEWITNLARADKDVRDYIIATSDDIRDGVYRRPVDNMTSILQGSAFRESPFSAPWKDVRFPLSLSLPPPLSPSPPQPYPCSSAVTASRTFCCCRNQESQRRSWCPSLADMTTSASSTLLA